MMCKICGNSEGNKEFKIKEMMFGFGDEFTYLECSKCGCLLLLQIVVVEVPTNMEKYYPSDYYSFKKRGSDNLVKRILRKKRDKYALFKQGFIGKIISMKYPNLVLEAIGRANINYNYNSRIQTWDGSGNLLYTLKELGFKNLVGVDPYIKGDIIDENIKIFKRTIHELPDSEKFDLIIFNHSFEHIPDQLETLLKVRRLLSERGLCLIRMPVKTEYNLESLWHQLGTDRCTTSSLYPHS